MLGQYFTFKIFEEYTETNPMILSAEDNIPELHRHELRSDLLKVIEHYILCLPVLVLDIQFMSTVYVMSHRLKNRMMSRYDYETIYEFYYFLKQNKEFQGIRIPTEYYYIQYSTAISNISPMFFISLIFMRITTFFDHSDFDIEINYQYKKLVLQYNVLYHNTELLLHLFDNVALENITMVNNSFLYSTSVINHTYLLLICLNEVQTIKYITPQTYSCYSESFIALSSQFALSAGKLSNLLTCTLRILTSAITKINKVAVCKISTGGIINWIENIERTTQDLEDSHQYICRYILVTNLNNFHNLYCEVMVSFDYANFGYNLTRIIEVIKTIQMQSDEYMKMIMQNDQLLTKREFLCLIVRCVSTYNFILWNEKYCKHQLKVQQVGNKLLRYLQNHEIPPTQMLICILKKYITACVLCRSRLFYRLGYVSQTEVEDIILNEYFIRRMFLKLKNWPILSSVDDNCVSHYLEKAIKGQ